jgi:formylglycine-generating enzyme required for sulfatase activity/energy-coupling factor transporter ATP-binding protein EcfA2
MTHNHIDRIEARNGAAAVGALHGALTINNIGVPADLAARLARPSPLPEDQALRVAGDLLQYVERYYRFLPLKGMGNTHGVPPRMPLAEVYVPPHARLILPQADTLDETLRVAGRAMGAEERAALGGRPDGPRPVLDLVREHATLVVLGDPGSGKSTLLGYLALAFATGQGGKLGLDAGQAELLPLRLPLAEYADRLRRQDAQLSLKGFITGFFAAHFDIHGLDALLEQRLHEGRVLLLLDGLDEVRELSWRSVVVDRVQSFLCRFSPCGNRVVLTSRIVGYGKVRLTQVEGLRECTLLDFGDAEIEAFLRRWTGVVERLCLADPGGPSGGPVYSAARETEALLAAVRGNPGVRKLASNPLLLTMLVIQKRNQVELPRQRVRLYEQYVQSLLQGWLYGRSPGFVPAALPNEIALRRLLKPLALWMQQTAPGQGLVADTALLSWLRSRFQDRGEPDPEQAAEAFLHDVREHSGLLIDRGGNRFGFLHLTFMEYLAGLALADGLQEPDGQAGLVRTLVTHAGAAEWRETLLLALGYIGLRQEQDIIAAALLTALLDAAETEHGAHAELVAAALADMGSDGVSPEAWVRLRNRLWTDGMRGQGVPAERRVRIGEHIAAAGDPRPGALTLDAMEFCRVPAGRFFLGAPDDQGFRDAKTGAGPHRLGYGYWLARWPLTVAQWRAYLAAAGREAEDADSLRAAANTPVVYVSWHEAMACADWLTEHWQGRGLLPAGWRVTLPSEPEWEQAAKGGEGIPAPGGALIRPLAEIAGDLGRDPAPIDNPAPRRLYPWGDAPDTERMNIEMDIGRVSPVGCYAAGASPYGCEELAGNVWEWTRSRPEPYPYPEDAAGRAAREVDPSGSAGRVLRGGAFNIHRWYARCSSRLDFVPDPRYYLVGLRLCLSPSTRR